MKHSKYIEYLNRFETHADHVIEQMIEWIQDEFKKTHASGIILGMSGGLDCSFVARLVQMANIPLQLVLMPNGSSMEHGPKSDAQKLIDNFKMHAIELPITELVKEMIALVDQGLADHPVADTDMAFANISPLMRMSILSTLGQSLNYVLIGTGNLTERTMGYFTKRGDGLSDFNPLGNITKSEIRILARKAGIPESIIEKAPSADLWEGQSDEKEMGVKIEDIDAWLLTHEGEDEIIEKILKANARNQHKLNPIPIYHLDRKIRNK